MCSLRVVNIDLCAAKWHFMSSLLRKSMFRARCQEKAILTPQEAIDKEMKLHPVRDTHSTFYEGVQKNKQMCTYFGSSLLKKSMFSRRGSQVSRKGNFYTPRFQNIDKEMKLHPVRDTHSTFYEGVQKTNKSVFRVQPIKEVHVQQARKLGAEKRRF